MNDEQITEFLKARAQVDPPPGLVASVMEAVGTVQPTTSWLAAALSIAAATGVAAIVGVVAVIVSNEGPPSGLSSAIPSASAFVSASPTSLHEVLVEPGASIEFAALDSEGEWGSIRVERRRDLGGYPDAQVDATSFVMEFGITYDAERLPDPADFGSTDWTLRPAFTDTDQRFILGPAQFNKYDGSGVRPDQPLGTYPGAVDILNGPIEGVIAFSVPRQAATIDLELVYAPRGMGEVAVIKVRERGPAPDHPAPSAAASPQDADYVSVDGLPITVIRSVQADALFERLTRCMGDAFALNRPEDWHTNAVSDAPPCSYFGPQPIGGAAPGQVPETASVVIEIVDGTVGYTSQTETYLNDSITVDQVTGRRVEFNPDPNRNSSQRTYHYVFPLASTGRSLVASTTTAMAEDYLLAKAVLDRMMATLELN